MSNYRRLISYIYAYEGGDKGKNIGFAKLEARNGQCKIIVSVKRVYVGSSNIAVYLLSGKDEIFLGNIFIRNGAGEFRTIVQYNNVEGSGTSMDDCYGLTLHEAENAWQSYTTIWEDAIAHAAEIELPSDSRAEEEKSRLPESEILEIHKELEEETKEEIQKEPEPAVIEDKTEEIAETTETENIKTENIKPDELEEPEILRKLEQAEAEKQDALELWNNLKRKFPKIMAFDYEPGCEILSITPQNIGELPRENWVYGNNSFMLHGYYNYRYLILAKINDSENGAKYLLGVPGHYYSNEKYMADMFGFPHFVLSKNQPMENGRFGYWYTYINIGN